MVFWGISCSEDFLEPDPLSFYAPENIFVDAEGLNSAIIACIENTRSEIYLDHCPFQAEQHCSDVAVYGTTDKAGVPMDLPNFMLPDDPMTRAEGAEVEFGRFWSANGYERIKTANLVINRIDDAEWESDEERNNILGKAYFHRANVYYRLVHQYGDVPVVLEEIQEPKLDYYTCTRESILQKMKKDLDFAAQWVNHDALIGDINNAAVNHLLTKVNLALGEFDDAIASASAVIDDGRYALMTERFGVDADDPTHDVIFLLLMRE